MKTKLLVGVLFAIYFKSSAQYQPVYYVEYFNSDRNQLKGGVELFSKFENYRFFYGVGYGLVNSNEQIKGLLDYHASYNSNNGFLVKVSGSDRNITSTVGLTLLNALDFGVGYSFPIKKDELPIIQGFTVGLTVRFSKNNDVYEKFYIGF